MSKFGFAVLVLTLPHHLTRSNGTSPVANPFLNANLGDAIRAVRQSVADVRLLTEWLLDQGCRQVDLVGVSLGSCVASLAAVFEHRISRTALLLTAGDFAETVWFGRATAHIRKAMGEGISLDQLRRIWAIISPINFVSRWGGGAGRLMLVSGSEDKVVLFDQTTRYIAALRGANVDVKWRVLPCGHYTLATMPFSVIALIYVLRHLLRR